MSAARKISQAYTILETKTVGYDPKGQAEIFGACLGADKGYASRIVRVDANTYDCVASDDRAIRFHMPKAKLRRIK